MERNSKQKLRNRALIALVFTILLGFGAGIAGMINVGLIHGSENRQKAEMEQLSDSTIAARRGTIYDKNGNVLAQSADAWKVYINPSEIRDEATAKTLSTQLARILDLNYKDVYALTQNKKSKYKVVKKQIDYDTKEKITKLKKENKGYYEILGLEDDVIRYYPYDNFASTVLGFTGSTNGSSGLEYYYNDTLTGVAGRKITAQNAKQDTISSDFGTYYAAQQGTSLQLTIDEAIQYYLDSALSAAVDQLEAKFGYGIVMDVKTGAILAMSSQPDYNCNDPYQLTDPKEKAEIAKIEDPKERAETESSALFAKWRNRTVTDTYEPGSVFKCITAAAGIEEGLVNPDEMFVCTGSRQVRNITYHCSNRGGHGREDFTHSLMNSCNPIYIEIAQRLGSERFCKYFDAFGFSESTGVDLPAEAEPKPNTTYYTVDQMGPVQLASSSFGQSFQISPIQMCTAINAIANDGKLMQPYVVDKYLDTDGNVVRVNKPVEKRQVISKLTADTVTEMMEQVVIGGTAKNAYVPGYKIAGKTGTSEKLNTKPTRYIGSFCGFAPADDPQITCLIVIDDPRGGSYTGGKTAAPVAAEVIKNTLRYLNVEPEYNANESQDLDVRTPNELGVEVTAAQSALQARGFQVKVIGSGKKVLAQNPAAGKLIPQKGIVVLCTDSKKQTAKVKVPNLTGLSFSQAKAAANAVGLNVEATGQASTSGASYSQSIATGTNVTMGSIITVSYIMTDKEMSIEDVANDF